MNIYELLGFAVGIGVGILLVALILKFTKKDGSMKCKYDERQELVRGKGFKYAFFTLLGYNVLYGMWSVISYRVFIDNFLSMTIGMCISIMVYVAYCIWNDAYFSLNEHRGKVLIAFLLIGIANLAIGIINLVTGEIFTNGVLNFRFSNLLCGFMFFVIFLLLLFKKISYKEGTE